MPKRIRGGIVALAAGGLSGLIAGLVATVVLVAVAGFTNHFFMAGAGVFLSIGEHIAHLGELSLTPAGMAGLGLGVVLFGAILVGAVFERLVEDVRATASLVLVSALLALAFAVLLGFVRAHSEWPAIVALPKGGLPLVGAAFGLSLLGVGWLRRVLGVPYEPPMRDGPQELPAAPRTALPVLDADDSFWEVELWRTRELQALGVSGVDPVARKEYAFYEVSLAGPPTLQLYTPSSLPLRTLSLHRPVVRKLKLQSAS